jgi:serine/threonine-protein kinase
MKALAKEKRDRWQTAVEFLAALNELQLGQSSQLRVQTLGPIMAPLTAAEGSVAEHSKFEPAELSEIALKLAHYVGPIASVLVKRASSSTNDLQTLLEHVAQEIEETEARRRFLTSVGGRFRKNGVLN